MTRIAPVRLNLNPKTLWFDARDLELPVGAPVVVLTARGVELGEMAEPVFEATDEQVANLKTELKPVKRLATQEDVEKGAEMRRLSDEALPIFKEMAAEASEDMRPVSVEYLLDGDKAVFYFEADDRVDFRELVRKLAARFHVRIDMRQIGVRDEARMVGGLGHCGQELCCKRLGGEFCPVSIRMAKEQDLSLNPQKISGVCGRLMCCLRYEYDAYKDFKSRAPKVGATIQTPDGPLKVSGLDVPREIVEIRTEDGKTVKIPLADMNEPAEGATRPNSVGEDAWEAATNVDEFGSALGDTFLTSQFTQADKLGEAKASRAKPVEDTGRKRRVREVVIDQDAGRKPRRRSTKVGGTTEPVPAPASTPDSSSESKPLPGRTLRVRRDRSERAEAMEEKTERTDRAEKTAEKSAEAVTPKRSVRERRADRARQLQEMADAAVRAEEKSEDKTEKQSRRRRRGRRGRGGSGNAEQGTQAQQTQKQSQGQSAPASTDNAPAGAPDQPVQSLRPGRRSSALRQRREEGVVEEAADQSERPTPQEGKEEGGSSRRRRRRRRGGQSNASEAKNNEA